VLGITSTPMFETELAGTAWAEHPNARGSRPFLRTASGRILWLEPANSARTEAGWLRFEHALEQPLDVGG
jgi:hypothetical protein